METAGQEYCSESPFPFPPYTLRKQQLKKTHVPQCSLQRYLQQLGHGSNLDVHRQVTGQRSYSTYMQWNTAAAAAKSLQSCLTLSDPIDSSPLVSSVHGILLSYKKELSLELVLTRWMNLEPIVQSEVSQKEKDKYCLLMHVYGL